MNISITRKLHASCLFASQNVLRHLFFSTTGDSLHRRISPLGDPKISVVPVLDQWVQEGKTVEPEQLQKIIKELTKYKRFKHALQISQWMSNKMYVPLSAGSVAARLNLILRVHGLEQMENYFNNVPKQLKCMGVYVALLNCYAHEKSVEKAEVIMQKMKDMGFARTPICYNILMNLYYQMGDHEKVDALMLEMEEKGISCDQFTFSIRLSAYAAASDIEGIDKMMEKMESNAQISLDWNAYAVAANGYLKVGLIDKGMAMLKKIEGLITPKNRNAAFPSLLKLYAETGKKEELYSIWNLYKEKKKIYNRGYMSMISSLLKLDDIEGAEKIFEDWESRKLSYDFRVPNLLIGVYCRKGLLEKAESLTNHAITKGGEPSIDAWFCLASMYLEDNQIPKAVEAMKKAILVYPSEWKHSKETLTACLEYLEGKGDVEEADEFIKLLRVEGIFSAVGCDRLLNYVKSGQSYSEGESKIVATKEGQGVRNLPPFCEAYKSKD